MKVIGITSAAVRLLLLGIAAPVYAQQDQQGEKEDHSIQEQGKSKQAKPKNQKGQQQRQSNQRERQPQSAHQQQSQPYEQRQDTLFNRSHPGPGIAISISM